MAVEESDKLVLVDNPVQKYDKIEELRWKIDEEKKNIKNCSTQKGFDVE